MELRVLNLSAPGMSQIYSGNFLLVPAKCMVLSFSIAPIVERLPLGIHPVVYLCKMAVLPTPESPTMTTLRIAKDELLRRLGSEAAAESPLALFGL